MNHRKKFFILNDDIEEAINGKQLLCDMLYHQVGHMLYNILNLWPLTSRRSDLKRC